MRWRMILIGAVLLMLGLLVGWPVAAHYRAKANLAKYKHQLQELGEKLTVAELAPKPSFEASRAAGNLMTAATFLRTPSPNWTNYPSAMKYIAPGKALVAWQQVVLPTTDTTNVCPGLGRGEGGQL